MFTLNKIKYIIITVTSKHKIYDLKYFDLQLLNKKKMALKIAEAAGATSGKKNKKKPDCRKCGKPKGHSATECAKLCSQQPKKLINVHSYIALHIT